MGSEMCIRDSYSASRKTDAGFVAELDAMPWADKVQYHFSDVGDRANFGSIMKSYQPGWHVYVCGPDRYMKAVLDAAKQNGFPDEACHLEYFSTPEQPDYVNRAFTVKLARSGRMIEVPEDKSISDVLQEQGFALDVKCDDGICGVCKCGLVDGDVEHRDFVLSKAQRSCLLYTSPSPRDS